MNSLLRKWTLGVLGGALALAPSVFAQTAHDSRPTRGGLDHVLNPVLPTVDLVFTPVTPCRIIDTRVAGGAINPGAPPRNFIASGGSYVFQGGSSGDCGIPFPEAVAVLINYIAVDPAGPGDLRVTPFGTPMPLASVINYARTSGLNVANGVATKVCGNSGCGFDITVQADTSATHLVADVMGFYRDVGCQAGTVKALGACFETGLRTGTTIFSASDTCQSVGGRLATGLELRSLRNANPLTLDSTGEWTDSLHFDTGGLGFSGMIVANSGGIAAAFTNSIHPFRCVYRSLP